MKTLTLWKSLQGREKRILSKVPKPFHHWLLDDSSLTQRLKYLSKGDFKVRLLCQRMEIISLRQVKELGLRFRVFAIVREVELLCTNKPCVYAKSIIPLTSLKGKQRHIAKLGNKSLGGALFSDLSLQREKINIVYLHSKKTWGRKSRFCIKNRPLLVYEYFLSELLEHKFE